MDTPTLVTASAIRKADVVRFTPRARRNRVTVRVTGEYDGSWIMGFRARVKDDGTVVTRGHVNAYAVPDTVELLTYPKDAPTVDIVIAFGRNIGATPMSAHRFDDFRVSAFNVVQHIGRGPVHAEVTGPSQSGPFGPEEATWIAATVLTASLPSVRAALANLAAVHGQECIALTVGATELVGADEFVRAEDYCDECGERAPNGNVSVDHGVWCTLSPINIASR